MKNTIWKIAVFVAGTVVMLTVLSLVFDGGFWAQKGYVADRDARIAGITTEEPGQIDVLNVGDSVCNVSMTPLELFRDYGYTAYNMGRDLQKPMESYFYIKIARRKQPVKVVLWEAHNLFRDQNIFDFGGSAVSEYFKYRYDFIKYHYIWKNWIDGPGIRKYFKGYLVNEAVKPYTGGDYYYWSDEEIYPIHSREKMLFKATLRYCRKRNIKLVLYSGASSFCYDIRMHNAVAQFAQECGVDYLDANYDRDKIQIDWSNDTFDGGDHLNLYGCRKMTKYLGDYLRDECELTDHRGDTAYQSWYDLLPAYEQELIDMEGTSYPIIEGKIKGESHRGPTDGGGRPGDPEEHRHHEGKGAQEGQGHQKRERHQGDPKQP